MNTIYEKNIEGLFSIVPDREKYLDKISNTIVENIAVEGDNVAVTYNNRWWYLNSCYDSKGCAEIFANQYSDMNEGSACVVFGFGNGEYIRSLMNVCCANIIVYEPSVECFKTVLENIDVSDIIECKRIYIAVGKKTIGVLREYLIGLLHYGNIKQNMLLSLPNYNVIYNEEYKEFVELYREYMAGIIFSRNTELLYGKEIVKNSMNTIPDAIEQYSIVQIKEVMNGMDIKNIPAILVSAGPSLDKNIHLLKEVKGRAFIMVVDTALKAVLRQGIIPDMTITVDSHKPRVLFEHEGFADVPMVVSLNSNPEVYNLHKGKRFYYSPESYLDYIYNQYNKKITLLESGGSVANDAFAFLRYIGFRKIILIGQDLAYPNKQGHSKEAYDGKEAERDFSDEKYFLVKDINGDDVYTEYNMDAYRKWFQSQIDRYKELEVIDATEGGAYIEGTIIKPLRTVIDELGEDSLNVKELIDAIEPAFSNDEVCEIREQLKKVPEEIDELKIALQQGIKDYNRMVELAGKQKWNSAEYKQKVKAVSDINEMADKNQLLKLAHQYNASAEYQVLESINEYDKNASQYTQIKQVAEYGIKMLQSYYEGIDKLSEDWNILLDKIR